MYLKHWNFLVQEQLFTRINLTVMAKHNIHGGISRFINTWRQVAILDVLFAEARTILTIANLINTKHISNIVTRRSYCSNYS